jgi:hypothetical protein
MNTEALINVGKSVASSLISELGEGVATGLLKSVVDFIGASAAKNRIDQFEAARLAADAAEAAKFGE